MKQLARLIPRPVPSRVRVFVARYSQGHAGQDPPKLGSGPSRKPGNVASLTSFAAAFALGTGLAYYAASQNGHKADTTSTTPLSASFRPQHDLTASNIQSAYDEICSIVGKDNVSEDDFDLHSHAGSEWSSYSSMENKPHFIVFPCSTEQVSKAMKVCHRRKLPVTPYAGGTSLEGNYAPTRGGVCIDFANMDKILELHERDHDVVVQPAVGWEELNEHLAEHRLFFPPDPGPGAKIGGMIGTGCSGTNAFRYGTIREWVLSLTVVLADGTIIKTRQRPRKSSAGYDLTKMFIGSEGTLGLVTEAVLKVAVLPQTKRVAVASFPNIYDAAECVSQVVANGVPLNGIEILDDVQMKCLNESGATSRSWKEAPTLFFRFGGTPLEVNEHISIAREVVKHTSGQSFEVAETEDEANELWSARKEALWSVIAKKRTSGDHVWTTDVAVPMTKMPDLIMKTKEEIKKSGLIGTIVGHMGDGNFHAFLLFRDDERPVAEGIVHRLIKQAIEMEGTVTGEHGVGLIKRDYLIHELGQDTVDAMRRLKQAYDPQCLLNCDKIIRMER